MTTEINPDILKIYSKEAITGFINPRAGETKFGENISLVSCLDELKNHPAKYVLLGIPEDIGVRANYGRAGTSKAWQAALSSLLNIQENPYLNPKNVILLGEINCDKQMVQAASIDMKEDHTAEEFGGLVLQIDHKVSAVIEQIVKSGKIPIVIGGGHNNSFGNIKGTSQALNRKINCINFDAHTDFRALEHRHSGNGFSYAFEYQFLNKYFIFGLHRNYTSASVFSRMNKYPDVISYNFFEDIAVHKKHSFSGAVNQAEAFCCSDDFGIEIDLDSIELIGSSAMTPNGFSLSEAREFLAYFSKFSNLRYIHLCEGAPKFGVFENQVGKALAYLISDIISEENF